MKLSSAVAGGIAGATVLTLLHEAIRRVDKDAPRMDLLGIEAITKLFESVDAYVPQRDKLFKMTMAGDLISNSLYYSLAGLGSKKQAIERAAILGIVAGLGAVYLPRPLGLNPAPAARTEHTKILTVALYTIGGIVAGITGKFIEKK